MNQKIVAAVLAVLLVALSFSACGKKTMVTNKKNGKEYEAVTDENGNVKFDPDGDIYAYQKDENGHYIKDENGERVTVLVETNQNVTSDLTVDTPDYRFAMPEKGWELDEIGKYTLKKADGQVYLKILALDELKYGQSLYSLVHSSDELNEQIIEEAKKNYPYAERTLTETEITDKGVPAIVQEIKIGNAEDDLLYYANAVFYVWGGRLYKVEFVCNDGKFYNPEFDLLKIVNENLVVKEKVEQSPENQSESAQ